MTPDDGRPFARRKKLKCVDIPEHQGSAGCRKPAMNVMEALKKGGKARDIRKVEVDQL